MADKPLGKSRSTETKYARVPLWLFQTGVSLQALATYAWLHGRYGHYEEVIPSYQTLADELGVSKGSVVAYMKELRKVGAVISEARYKNGDRTTNEYVIAFNEPFEVVSMLTTFEQGEHENGGQNTDRGGQPADQGGQNTDQGGQPTGTRKKTYYTDEPKNTSSSSKAPPPTPLREDVDRLCNHLADLIEANGSKRPNIGKRWHDAARLMIDRDERTEQDIRAAIDWCQRHEFWRTVILSMSNLRAKYDQLSLQAQRERNRPQVPAQGRPSNVDVWDQAAARDEHQGGFQ